ncbi:class I SAM-dependent methyltransferase [uncultured Roseovarius sp.]|uniref:class I SAM-dependent DNA methyltransferase n=1 Tax=uncultured Roseovarius sp. TaxID=293344 RepID=UPI002609EF04|nr:class I SAM-dependent methyltransferase [uncultured Roseovarius sp.]
MSSDIETLKVYGDMADDYAALANEIADPALTTFIGALPKGSHVLDLGCGPGFAAGHMARAGLTVDATDAAPAMVELAGKQDGVNAWVATFDDLTGSSLYDGIWANFSLLHAPRGDMPRYLGTLRELIKTGGMFHIGMKTGTGEHRDALGRLYTYYTEEELTVLLNDARFTPFSSTTGRDKGLDGEWADWVTITAHA